MASICFIPGLLLLCRTAYLPYEEYYQYELHDDCVATILCIHHTFHEGARRVHDRDRDRATARTNEPGRLFLFEAVFLFEAARKECKLPMRLAGATRHLKPNLAHSVGSAEEPFT